jgi:hypothetical protein
MKCQISNLFKEAFISNRISKNLKSIFLPQRNYFFENIAMIMRKEHF